MTYSQKVWASDVAGNTPVTPGELARIELGVDQAYGRSASTLVNSTVTAETVIAQWNIDANTLSVTDLLVLKHWGQAGGTGTLTFRLRFGTAGTTADAQVIAFAATAAQVLNQHVQVELSVPVLTATTMAATGRVQSGATTLGPTTAALATATVNLTVANKLSLTVQQSAAATYSNRFASIAWMG